MKKKGAKRNEKLVDVKADKIKSKLRFGGNLALSAVYKFKSDRDIQWVLTKFPSFFAIPHFRDVAFPYPFPDSPGQMLRLNPLGLPSSYLTEIYWATAICLQFTAQLNEFIENRKGFEHAVLQSAHADARVVLQQIFDRFGYSIWYIQNDLTLTQDEFGLDEQRRKSMSYRRLIGDGNVLSLILRFISKRSEGTSLRDGLRQDIDKLLSGYEDNPHFTSYFKAKLVSAPYYSVRDISGILYFEATSSLIDLYESLIMILQIVSGDPDVPTDTREKLIIPLAKMSSVINDGRLKQILRGLGSPVEYLPNEIGQVRSKVFDFYTLGEYSDCINCAERVLEHDPNDIAVIMVVARALAQSGEKLSDAEVLWKEVVNSLANIWRASDSSFFAAYTMMTLVAKYYGHTWAAQLKIAIHEMLAIPETALPSESERHLYIFAEKTSPFAALAFRNVAQRRFLASLKQYNEAPVTSSLVLAIMGDECPLASEVVVLRLRKYRARQLLAIRDFAKAKLALESLRDDSDGIQRQVANVYLLLCAVLSSDTGEAIKIAVNLFLENPNLVSRIPLNKMGKLLDDPSVWPFNIELPLFFEIYSTYSSNDKDQHLRYSFERFQEHHSLSSPAELVGHFDQFRKELVVAYLDKVCQPNVMRQTLLFEDAKEVDNERVKICRVLAEIDPINSNRYLDEVRERVKALEISNGLSIVEQSLVYVDIAAITKSLKARLKDSYSQYRSLSENSRASGDGLLKDAVVTLSNINPAFRNIHFLDFNQNEQGSVYEEMFREVTNEFLKSDHGLNAFLSTRIRHGKLRNLLRKPVEDGFLVTSRKEVSDVYQRNSYWLEELGGESPENEQILLCLTKFSRDYDNAISYILEVLLQIQIIGSPIQEGDTKAWFVYHSSSIEMTLMRWGGGKDETLEEFIDRSIEFLWQKTDANLQYVKAEFAGELHTRFVAIFDELTRGVVEAGARENVQPLLDAIALAKNETQQRLHTAANWFNRSVVYDRPDYALDVPANIAIAVINNIRSGLTSDFSDYVKLIQAVDSKMPGRTLDGLVDLFSILLENAIDHCGLGINELDINISIEYENSSLRISVTNNILSDVKSEESILVLNGIKDALGKDGAKKFLQNEGRSGFHKIWKILSGPAYSGPKLTFDYVGEKEFSVVIEAEVEQYEENTIH